jgi:methyltransferase (TIGR00027 family)
VGWHTGWVTERAASTTAVLVCQGRACAHGRYAVGQFDDPIARELLDPAERVVVDRVRADDIPTTAAERMAYEMVRRTGVTLVPRTIAIDTAIDDAIRHHDARQLVILGAGLDARAYRMPELSAVTVFEVDHPASQRDKVRRAGALAPVAERLVLVAVDLGSTPLASALEGAGFDKRVATTWVWEGVVPYLRPAEVRATVEQVSQLSAPGSRLVINYQGRSLPTTLLRRLMRLVLRVSGHHDPLAGEPWRSLWRPEQLRKLLEDNGFNVMSDRDLGALSQGLDLPSDNAASLRNGRVAVAARL